MSKDNHEPQSSEISQADQSVISSSDMAKNHKLSLDDEEPEPVMSADTSTIAHEIVTTSEDGGNPQTLYVAIQPQGDHGSSSHDQPAVYLEVVESGNLPEQITSAGEVLEGQMILQQGNQLYYGGITLLLTQCCYRRKLKVN